MGLTVRVVKWKWSSLFPILATQAPVKNCSLFPLMPLYLSHLSPQGFSRFSKGLKIVFVSLNFLGEDLQRKC